MKVVFETRSIDSASVAGVTLLFEWVAVHVVAVAFPKTWLVFVAQLK